MDAIPHPSNDLVPPGCSSSEWDEAIPLGGAAAGAIVPTWRADPRHPVVIQPLLGAR
jgi:hypothetical protein